MDYLHRAGRTARFGKKGKICSLVGKRDVTLASAIERAVSRNEPLDMLSSDKRDYQPGGSLAKLFATEPKRGSDKDVLNRGERGRESKKGGYQPTSRPEVKADNHHKRSHKKNEEYGRRGVNRGKKVVTSPGRGSGQKETKQVVEIEKSKTGHKSGKGTNKAGGKGRGSSGKGSISSVTTKGKGVRRGGKGKR